MRESQLSQVRFQKHVLVFLTVVLLFSLFNGLDTVWMMPAGLWLLALILHGFAAYRLGPFFKA